MEIGIDNLKVYILREPIYCVLEEEGEQFIATKRDLVLVVRGL